MKAMFRLLRNRRGVIGVFTAVSLPITLGISALVVDAGLWTVTQTRLQYAADAAASATGYLLTNASVKAQSTTATLSTFQAVALAAVNDATGMRLIGTLTTPISVKVASDYSSVMVTLTSQAPSYFAGAVGFQSSPLTATATAGLRPPVACVLALSTASSQAVNADNSGSIRAKGCAVFSNSSASDSLYASGSGAISGVTVGSHGGAQTPNSGSITPSPTTYAGTVADPFAAKTVSTPACDPSKTSKTAFGTWNFTPGAYCGNITFGGGGSTVSFAAGVYYIIGGDATFASVTVQQATDVSFVLTGSTPGRFIWSNSANATITAPTSGATAGMVFWQACPSSGPGNINSFSGSATLTLSGAFYAPCGEIAVSNSGQIVAPSGGSLSFVANRISSSGSGLIQAASTAGTSGSSTVALQP